MSLKDIKETYGKPEFQGNNTGESLTYNLPVRITGYEEDTLIGIRLDNDKNEEVRVQLREIKTKANSKYSRPVIKDFSNPKHKRYAEPEKTTIVAESAYIDKNGVFQARWIKAVSSNPDISTVRVYTGSFLIYERKKGEETEEIAFVKVIVADKAKEATNEEELRKLLARNLRPKTPGSNPLSFVRITDKADGEKVVIEIKPVREKDKDGHNRVVDGEKSVKAFMESDASIMLIKVLESNDENIKIEVIAGTVIFPGSATREQMTGLDPELKKQLQEAYYIKSESEGGNGNVVNQSGFLPTVIALRKYEDESPFYTYCRPLINRDKAKLVEEL